MVRFLQHARRTLLFSPSLRSPPRPVSFVTTPPTLPSFSPSCPSLSPARSYISEMRRSAFQENLLRILRTEIDYEVDVRPPQEPVKWFKYFEVEDRPGEQWITLKSKYGEEEIKADVTMFDYAVPTTVDAKVKESDGETMRLHISLVVDVRKGVESDAVLQFICSAWPDALEIQHVRAVKDDHRISCPFMGPRFKDLEEELQRPLLEYLEERSVDAELAVFLHQYMMDKDRREFVRWMGNVKSYVEK